MTISDVLTCCAPPAEESSRAQARLGLRFRNKKKVASEFKPPIVAGRLAALDSVAHLSNIIVYDVYQSHAVGSFVDACDAACAKRRHFLNLVGTS